MSMPKTIVTHRHPDLDAIMGIWLLTRFDPNHYGNAELAFIPGSTTYQNQVVDSDEEVIHEDVGYGKYDHHQEGRYGTCAAELIWQDLITEGLASPTDQALKAMVEHTRAIDLFEDCVWPEAREARFAFSLSEIIPALHRLQKYDDEAVVQMSLVQLDGVYQKLKDWYQSQRGMKTGIEFQSRWGRGIAVENGADDLHKVAQRAGYEIVVVGDLKRGYLGIKTKPGNKESLRALYDKIMTLENSDEWFYHNSGQMLLYGSDKGSRPAEPPKLTVSQVVKLIQELSKGRR